MIVLLKKRVGAGSHTVRDRGNEEGEDEFNHKERKEHKEITHSEGQPDAYLNNIYRDRRFTTKTELNEEVAKFRLMNRTDRSRPIKERIDNDRM
jgi:hypothetical protein